MDATTLEVGPGNEPKGAVATKGNGSARWVVDPKGNALEVPSQWDLLEPGDPAATRRVKKAGPHWVMSEKRGRRRFGLGVWAPRETILEVRDALVIERADPAYAARLQKGRARRAQEQVVYEGEFTDAVRDFLDFSLRYADFAQTMADAIAAHATPVGSGTVARTKRIPVEKRAEAATIAWMRHQTTAYDTMKIARVRGKRREVRRELAARSRDLLMAYRRGADVSLDQCPLAVSLNALGAARADQSERSAHGQ